MELAEINVALVLRIGAATTVAMLLKAVLEPIGIPPLVGYVLLGLALGELAVATGGLPPATGGAFELLASLGLVALLFRVGVGSYPHRLWRKLPMPV